MVLELVVCSCVTNNRNGGGVGRLWTQWQVKARANKDSPPSSAAPVEGVERPESGFSESSSTEGRRRGRRRRQRYDGEAIL